MVFPCAVHLRGTGKRRLFRFQRVVKSPRMGENPARCAKGTVRRKCVSAPAFRTARRNAPQKTAERPAPRDTSSALRLCPPRRASPGPANLENHNADGRAEGPRPRKRGNLSPSRPCPPRRASPGPANAETFRPQGSVSFTTHLPAPRTRESFAFKALSPSLRIPRPRKRGKLSPSKALPPSLRIPGPANAGIFRLQRLCLHRCASPAPRTWELFTCSCSIRLKTGL